MMSLIRSVSNGVSHGSMFIPWRPPRAALAAPPPAGSPAGCWAFPGFIRGPLPFASMSANVMVESLFGKIMTIGGILPSAMLPSARHQRATISSAAGGSRASLHLDPGGAVADLAQVVSRELDPRRADVFLEPVELCSARNRHNPRLLREQPGQRYLGRCRFLPDRNSPEQIDKGQIRLAGFGREARDQAAEI